jgi:pimeloyl-ACP methyl ester carboxylesterase
MTMFIDLRALPRGGDCAHEASFWDGGDRFLRPAQFAARVAGQHLVVATHGFNVDRATGIVRLGAWRGLYTLPPQTEYVGLLWPGDAQLLRVIDYPVEGTVAIDAGDKLADALNDHAARALSISLVSHSLGARVILQAARRLARPVRVAVLMASAIENDCLMREYTDATRNIVYINVVASRRDHVLQLAYPAGNLIGRLFMGSAPNLEVALGRDGPDPALLTEQLGNACQIHTAWDFDHGDYLPSGPGAPVLPPDMALPAGPARSAGATGEWKPAWAAAYASRALEQ